MRRVALGVVSAMVIVFLSAPAFAQDNKGAGEAVTFVVGAIGGAGFGELISDISKEVDSGRGNGDDPATPSDEESDPGVGNNGPDGGFETPTNSGGG